MNAIIRCATCISLAATFSCAEGIPVQKKTSSAPQSKEKPMEMDDIPYLPLGITKDTPLNEVTVFLAFYSAKTGAGKQEITLYGDGRVQLFLTRSSQDKSPKVLEGRCEPAAILRLLDLMEGLGVFGLPDESPADGHPHARRLLEVKMPGRFKRIALDEPGNYSVEQIIGAIKLAAGLCLPEALNHRFFPNL